MKYLMTPPCWCPFPARYIAKVFDIPLNVIETYGNRYLIDDNLIDINFLENKGFITEQFNDESIKIAVYGSYAQVINVLDDFVLSQLDKLCSYEIDNTQFMQRAGMRWDGVIHMFKKHSRRFPIGLLWRVSETIKRFYKGKRGIEVIDDRPEPIKISMPNKLREIELRDYQIEAIEKAIEMGSGLLNLPIRSGKSIIAFEIIRRLGLKCAYVVPRKKLLRQTKRFFAKYLGIEAGVVGSGKVDIKDVTLFMIQTVASHLKQIKLKLTDDWKLEKDDTKVENIQNILNQFHVVFFDEGHTIGARTFFTAGMGFENARYRYTMTATPYRDDNHELAIFAVAGDIIYTKSISELIRKGYLVRPTIKFREVPKEFYPGLRYQQIYKEYIVNNAKRNGMIVDSIIDLVRRGRKVLVLVEQINHGKNILKKVEEFASSQDINISISFVRASGEGNISEKEREIIEDKFLEGKLDCLIATSGIYMLGVDIPRCDSLIVAGSGKSKVATIQRLRCLTPYENKEDAEIIDFSDNAKYLRTQSNQRLSIYREEEEFNLVMVR